MYFIVCYSKGGTYFLGQVNLSIFNFIKINIDIKKIIRDDIF